MGTRGRVTTVLVNGERRTVDADEDTPLLYVLRNHLGLTGTTFGCGAGSCGACAVLVDGQAAQCGYCLSGIVVTAAALLAENPDPSDAEVRAALDGNLCRCGAHNRMVRAVLAAAAAQSAEGDR